MNGLEKIQKDIAQQLRVEMAKQELKDAKLARQSKLARPTITMLRNGSQLPTVETLCKVANGLNKKLSIKFEELPAN
jgi:transcriptional regulator with XRE-family HTH domain